MKEKTLKKITSSVMSSISDEEKEKLVAQAQAKFNALKLKAKNGCKSSYKELVKQIEMATGKKVDHDKLNQILAEFTPA